jgi:hypothetical protein
MSGPSLRATKEHHFGKNNTVGGAVGETRNAEVRARRPVSAVEVTVRCLRLGA